LTDKFKIEIWDNLTYMENSFWDQNGSNFWLKYDSSFKKKQGYLFCYYLKIGKKMDFQWIGARNLQELISYLNSENNNESNLIEKKDILLNQIINSKLYNYHYWMTMFNFNIKY
jgi:hypothetical protein